MVNTKALKDRMNEKEITLDMIAEAIDKKPVTARQKISNVRPIFLNEAEVIQNLLEIPDDEFRHYFFEGS